MAIGTLSSLANAATASLPQPVADSSPAPGRELPNVVTREPMANKPVYPLRYNESMTEAANPIHPSVRIGHVHLKVANLDRSLGFYCGVLGFTVKQRLGRQAAFIAAGDYHHHIGLNTWESEGGSAPPRGSTGLYHVALLYPTRAQLAAALRRLMHAGIELDGASDHGVSEALYLRDPDGNGIELYYDRSADAWPRRENGELSMYTRPLDLRGLLAEAEPE